jgi:hypothetical protein
MSQGWRRRPVHACHLLGFESHLFVERPVECSIPHTTVRLSASGLTTEAWSGREHPRGRLPRSGPHAVRRSRLPWPLTGVS